MTDPSNTTSISGGVDLTAQEVNIGGDVVGRDKIVSIQGYTVEEVKALLAQISTTFQPRPFDERCPYLGLEAFTEEDADRFFGRETLVAELIAQVRQTRGLFIAGPSGSGKSSLVRAGLLHQLKCGILPNSERWLYAILTPGRNPIEALALAVGRMAKSPDAGDYVRQHADDPLALHKTVAALLSDERTQRAVIIVDQFEETFTQINQEAERAAFLDLLTTAATADNGRVTVLFVLRSDFVANCALYPRLNALLNQHFRQVGALQPDELVSAIARPALQVGLRIDPDLIAQIVTDMRDQPGALPLMQFALRDLFDAQQRSGALNALRLQDYLARGGLQKSLERHADAAFASLSADEQQLARSILGSLIEIGQGTADTRRTALFDELVPAGADRDQVFTVVRKLADARLIITDEREDHVRTATIAHEKLIETWPWLHRLINDNRESIALQNQIAEDAQAWQDHQRDASYLYAGARLSTARERLAERKIVLNGLAQTFVRASQARQQRQQAAWRVGIAAIMGTLVLAVIIFSNQSNESAHLAQQNAQIAGTAQAASTQAVSEAQNRATAEADANQQRDEIQRQAAAALSRQLASRAELYRPTQPDLAMLLGVEAFKMKDTAEARSALLSTLQYGSHWDAALSGQLGEVESVVFSPDGQLLASSSGDYMTLWDMADPRSAAPLSVWTGYTATVTSMAFSPDGKTLATISRDGTILLWDVNYPNAPEPLGAALMGPQNRFSNLTFSPDGKLLAAGGCGQENENLHCIQGQIQLWDVSNPQVAVPLGAPLNGHTDSVVGVAFSLDGKWLFSGSEDSSIITWDVTDPKAPRPIGSPLKGDQPSALWSLALSPDGKLLAAGRVDTSIVLWDVSKPMSPTVIGQPLTGQQDSVSGLAFSPDGKVLVSKSGGDPTVLLWDISNPQVPTRLAGLSGHATYIMGIAFSSDGQTLAVADSDKVITLWNVTRPWSPAQIGLPLAGHAAGLSGLALNPTGTILASSSDDTSVVLWDVANPQAPAQLGQPLFGHGRHSVWSVTLSPTGQLLASSGEDNEIALWDITNPISPTLLSKLVGHQDVVTNVRFSPDGKTLASASYDKSVILWDVTDPRKPTQLNSLHDHTGHVWAVVFSPDGKWLASASTDRTISLQDVSALPSLTHLSTLSGHTSDVTSLAFSPDGKMLVSGSDDKTVILWDVSLPKSPTQLNVLSASNVVKSVVFSPDGKTLAVVDWNQISLWDVTDPKLPVRSSAALGGHTDHIWSVVFSPNGKTLISGSSDKTIILWDISPESWQVKVCAAVRRNLTREEWQRFMGELPYHKTCNQWPEG